MTTQPPFGGDDTTTSYSPRPAERPRWPIRQSWSTPQPQTPERWFEPNWQYHPPRVEPVDQGSRGRTAGTAAALVLVSAMSAIAAAAGTAYLLRGPGAATDPGGQ